MKKFKKLLVVLLAMSMVLSMAGMAMAAAGDGTIDSPYELEAGGEELTVTIAKDETKHFVINDNGSDNDVTVKSDAGAEWQAQYGRNDYEESDGSGADVTFTVIKEWGQFFINNLSDDAITVKVSAAKGAASGEENNGSMENPLTLEVPSDWRDYPSAVSSWDLEEAPSIEAGSEGIYYTLKAPADAVMVFGMSASDEEYVNVPYEFSLTNNTTSRSETYSYTGEDDAPTGFLEVNEGDEVLIYLNTYNPEDMFNTPAAAYVNFDIAFAEAGSEFNPEVVGVGEHTFDNTPTMMGGAQHYYKFIAKHDGTLQITAESNGCAWQYSTITNDEEWGFDYVQSINEDSKTPKTIELKAGDTVTICAEHGEMMPPEEGSTITVKLVYTEKVLADITSADAGAKVEINSVEGKAVVSEGILAAAKDKDVNLVLAMEGYTWTINGKDIKEAADLDLTITPDALLVLDETELAVAGNDYKTFSIAHDGEFNANATLLYAVGKDKAGKNATLYYRGDKGLEKVNEAVVVDEDGNVAFTFTHASDYVVVLSEQKPAEQPSETQSEPQSDEQPSETQAETPTKADEKTDGNTKTGDSANVMILIAVAVVTAGVAIVSKKRMEA